MKKIFGLFMTLCCLLTVGFRANGADLDLSGQAFINITSDTSANAKNIAFDEARRQILMDALMQYSNEEQLKDALASADSNNLLNLIASSSIEGEKLSDTTYSANISMTIDATAAKQWMTENNIQNWLNDGDFETRFIVLISTQDKLTDWIQLNQISRQENIDLSTQYIMGNQISVELPVKDRAKFTIAVREAGWHYNDQDGVLRVWK